MLGDNTQDSSDSREWKTIDYKWNGPGSEGAWVSGNLREGNENPATVNGCPNAVLRMLACSRDVASNTARSFAWSGILRRAPVFCWVTRIDCPSMSAHIIRWTSDRRWPV